MKHVIVSAKVEYSYHVEVPDDVFDFITYCDSADPVYERMTKALEYEGLDYEGTIVDIYDQDKEQIIYEG